jgi:Polyketide cyclase / dehydrase and lipid transport
LLPRTHLLKLASMPEERRQLRYRDGPSTEVEIYIEAEPAAVWEVVSDISLPSRFSSELLATAYLDGASGPTKGARFAGRNYHKAAGEWQTECTIVDFDPGRLFGYVVDGAEGPSSYWAFSLCPEGTGTRLVQRMRMGPGRSYINVAIDAMPDKESRILQRRLDEHRKNMEANLQGIKDLLEKR